MEEFLGELDTIFSLPSKELESFIYVLSDGDNVISSDFTEKAIIYIAVDCYSFDSFISCISNCKYY